MQFFSMIAYRNKGEFISRASKNKESSVRVYTDSGFQQNGSDFVSTADSSPPIQRFLKL